MRRLTLLVAATAATVLTTPALASLMTLDFSTDDDGDLLQNGQILNNGTPGEFGTLCNIFSTGANAGLGVFDSTPGMNIADRDLWVGTGNVLILQNSGSSRSGDFWDAPNDDNDGGSIIFSFLTPVELQSILLIDIDEGGAAQVFLQDGQGRQRAYDVPDEWTGEIDQGQPGMGILDLTTDAPQAGYKSMATMLFEDAGFDPTNVLHFTVQFSGSAALDDLVLAIPGPAPSALSFMIVSLACGRRRRRRG